MSDALHAVVRGGRVAEDDGGGTIVPWWSFTKTVLAAAALTLVRDGALALDGTVEGKPFTLRQLLQHRAGLGDYGEVSEYHAAVARNDEPWPAEDMLRRADADRLRYPPGAGWRYSNIGYFYVRSLIERSAAAPLDQILASRVLEPLGVASACVAATRDDLANVAMESNAVYHPGWVYHGLLVGPVGEAALLLDRLLGGALLPPTLLAEMLRAHPIGPPLPGRPWQAPAYGLGLMIEATAAGPAGHSGEGPGSVIAVYRARGATAAVFALGATAGDVEHPAFAKL